MSEIEIVERDWFVARNGEVGVVVKTAKKGKFPNYALYKDGVSQNLTKNGAVYTHGQSEYDAVRKIYGPAHIPFDRERWPAPVDSGWRGPGLYFFPGDGSCMLSCRERDHEQDKVYVDDKYSVTGVPAKFIVSVEELRERLELAGKENGFVFGGAILRGGAKR